MQLFDVGGRGGGVKSNTTCMLYHACVVPPFPVSAFAILCTLLHLASFLFDFLFLLICANIKNLVTAGGCYFMLAGLAVLVIAEVRVRLVLVLTLFRFLGAK